MRHPSLLVLCLPLLASLPAVAADWSPGDRDHFVQECKTSAQASVPADKLQRYCGCAADKVAAEFSAAELDALKVQKTPLPEATHQRLVKVSQACLSQLNG
ncbi:hypothetical protein [Metapseudomonas furukawaii]|uniref:Lipoprotein n=1 Tax=Metapseudomonas furukawaii TaxID=1149133 RepID=A0AAD1BX72_METFU|nr:hypothetical protein [Pseudomonas furukawaii]ELS27337.1 hypothetical protein ppKF707_2741 [Pseudomonas furukawaii]WAG79505.1 hypothetical protein LMK08_02225 [Pseudomonas furukawaii]BAU72082.1 hypothetical protein KF707C_3940 [Pseudomonas furukawaii]